MNISTKVVLASTLLVALFAGASVNAEGRAGGNSDYADNSTTSIEIKKVKFESSTVEADYGVNR